MFTVRAILIFDTNFCQELGLTNPRLEGSTVNKLLAFLFFNMLRSQLNIRGQRFGRWTVIEESYKKDYEKFWLCKCDCGTEKVVSHNSLVYHRSKSCSCLRNDASKKPRKQKRLKIIAGQKLNNFFTAIKEVEPKNGSRYWLAKCSCGTKKVVNLCCIRFRPNLSCGCYSQTLRLSNIKTHGKSHTPEHKIYKSILQRCYDKNCKSYPNYGGRNITVYQPWRKSFKVFYDYLVASIGLKPSSNHSIDRIDNNKGYQPGNIKWSTKQEQANNRRSNRLITAFNKTQTLAQWERETKISASAINSRIKNHWNIEDALTWLPDNNRKYPKNKKHQ